MSIRPEPHTPFDRTEWVNLARERLRWGSTGRVEKWCGHQYCDLSQPHCCSCIDNRPHRERYLKYVDGRGMVLEGKRWSDYCPACKFKFIEVEEAAAAAEPAVEPPRGEDGGTTESRTRCVTCGEPGHAMWDCPQTLQEEDEPPPTWGQSPPPGLAQSFHRMLPTNPRDSVRPELEHTRLPPSHETSPQLPTASSTSLLSSIERFTSLTESRRATNPPTHPPPPVTATPSSSRPIRRSENYEQRRARSRAHFERAFGTMSEIANDPNYISPITALYNGAYARFQEREQERREHMESLRARTAPRPSLDDPAVRVRLTAEYDAAQTNARRLLESLRRRVEEDNRLMAEAAGETSAMTTTAAEEANRDELNGQRPPIFGRWYDRSLDTHRRTEDVAPVPPPPEPLSKEELQITDECKVCFAQHCDMLLLPCAHLVLCEVNRTVSCFWQLRSDIDSGVPTGRILRSMCGGFIISVLYVVPRSQKWYSLSKVNAYLVDQDISMLIIYIWLSTMKEHYIAQNIIDSPEHISIVGLVHWRNQIARMQNYGDSYSHGTLRVRT